jgi:ribosomal protein S18 acetylase RimI-like enzyme
VIRDGETYALDRDMPKADALRYWMDPPGWCFVAEGEGGAVLGTYFLRRNQAGGGSHMANCGYMVAPEARGRGIARRMAEHSLKEARRQGFRAMQFNFVVATNSAAIRLWHSLGFERVGRLPESFNSPAVGLTDALVMFRRL